jgi:hypothetical protein
VDKNGSTLNGAGASAYRSQELLKELSELRARFAEISSALRREHGPDSAEVRLSESVSHAIQCLEAQVAGCPSAHFER